MALSAGGNVLDLYRAYEWMVGPAVAHFPPQVRDDAEQAARIGLWRAARTWQPSKSKFHTWAKHRIRWEVQDELRRMDWLTRHDRIYLTSWQTWARDWERCNGTWPSDADTAAAGFDPKRVSRLGVTNAHIAPESVPDPAHGVEVAALANIAVDALLGRLAGLPGDLWVAATLAWVDDWPVPTIAEVLGLSESRIYQRLTQARQLLADA